MIQGRALGGGPCLLEMKIKNRSNQTSPNKTAGNSETPFWFNSEEAALAWLYFQIKVWFPA
jgi:hypothetical protein